MAQDSSTVTQQQSLPCGFAAVSCVTACWWSTGAARGGCRQLGWGWDECSKSSPLPALAPPFRGAMCLPRQGSPGPSPQPHAAAGLCSEYLSPSPGSKLLLAAELPGAAQQALLCRSLPTQGFPPPRGAGLSQCRRRCVVPAWQGLHGAQQLQCPSISPPGNTWRTEAKGKVLVSEVLPRG